MAFTELFTGSASIPTTETSLVSGTTTLASNTTKGIYQLFLDLSALVAGDSYTLKVKEAVQVAGTQRIVQSITLAGVQTEPVYVTPALAMFNGWDYTLTNSGGVARTIAWSIRQVA